MFQDNIKKTLLSLSFSKKLMIRYLFILAVFLCLIIISDHVLNMIISQSFKTPNNENIEILKWVVYSIGFLMMLLLCFILLYVYRTITSSEKALQLKTDLLSKADSQSKEMFIAYHTTKNMVEASPFGCLVLDQKLQILSYNLEFKRLFHIRDENQSLDPFGVYSPKFQPDGQLSVLKATRLVQKALTGEKQDLSWLNQEEDGTPIPTKLTFVAIEYYDQHAVACFFVDLRDEKRKVCKTNLTHKLMIVQNRTTEILLSSMENNENSNVSTLLPLCMDLLGHSMEVDKIQLWMNTMNEQTRHFVLADQWVSDFTKMKEHLELGTIFSYKKIPDWEQVFLKGESIYGSVAKLNRQTRDLLRIVDVKSLAYIPIFVQENFWGFLGIEDYQNERNFTEEEIDILHSISLIMASAFIKSEIDKKLKETMEETRIAKKVKIELLSKMSHEIRTAMNVVLGMTELLIQDKLTPRQREYVGDIYSSEHSLLAIINDILDVSRIETEKIELNPVNFDFLLLIDNINYMFKFLAEKKGIKFILEKSLQLPQSIFADDTRLRQILTNICHNAVQFTQAGTVSLKVALVSDNLLFEIKDTGRGMKEEEISKLFQETIPSKPQKNKPSLERGIGLMLTKAYVEMMQGTIFVDSELGSGSTFTILIPFIEGDINAITSKNNHQDYQNFHAPEAKILVVDNNEFNLKVAVELLRLFKIGAQTANSGDEAIELVKKNDYDLIFMDHMMPHPDGIETTQIIRGLKGKYRLLPIIALTANTLYRAKEMYINNGLNGFLSKPINIQELGEIIRMWVPQDKIILNDTPEVKKDNDYDLELFENLNRISDINLYIGLDRVSQDKKIYLNSINTFYKFMQQECDRITNHLQNNNIHSFGISIHAMKSSLAFIGAMDLSAVAAQLEDFANQGDLAACQKEYSAFIESMMKLQHALANIFTVVEKRITKKQGTPQELEQGLQSVILAAEKYDNELARNIINEILNKNYADDVTTALQNAAQFFDEFEFENGVSELKKIKIPLSS